MERNPTNVSTDESLKDDSDADSTPSSRRRSSSNKIAAPLLMRSEAAASQPTDIERPRRLQDILQAKKAEITDPDPETGQAETLAELSSEETQHITAEYARAELDARTDLDEETEAALEPGTRLLEAVSEGADPEVVFAEIATELGMTEDEIALALAETSPDDTDETSNEPGSPPPEEVEAPVEVDDDEGEIDLGAAAAAAAASAPGGSGGKSGSGTGSGSGSGSGSGGGTPPLPPPAPTSSPLPAPSRAPSSATHIAALHGPNMPPTVTQHNVLPVAASSYYERRRQAGQLLLVGVLAYLYGRRKGRIRTEKQYKPVQARLEKQVTRLQQDVSRKEQQLVALKAERRPQAAIKSPAGQEAIRRTEAVKPAENRRQPGRQETRLGLEKPARAEQLGHVIMAAEAPKLVERTRAQTSLESLKKARPEAVKDMSRSDLLELSEKIIIEGASLRSIYESRLIGEKQLRHLVSEHLQGKDIRKALRREMVEREIDFERDPIMRDRVHKTGSSKSSASGALGAMLSKAGVVDDAANPELQSRREREAKQRTKQEQRQKQQRMVTDVALTTAIVVLAVAVVILMFRG